MYSRAWGGGNSILFSFLFFRPFFCLTHKSKKRDLRLLCVCRCCPFLSFFLSRHREGERGIHLWESFGESKKT